MGSQSIWRRKAHLLQSLKGRLLGDHVGPGIERSVHEASGLGVQGRLVREEKGENESPLPRVRHTR
jgi:hypothetical protein